MSTASQPLVQSTFPLRTPPLEGAKDASPLHFSYPWVKWFQALETLRSKSAQFFFGSHAQRANLNAARYPNGSVFFESDRTVFYVIINGVWTYLTGSMATDQNDLPGDLGTADAGFLVYITDYNHQLTWNGFGFQWAPGEVGGGYSVPFVTAPNPVTGWHVCDGSTVLQLQPDGTTVSTTIPNTAGAYFRL